MSRRVCQPVPLEGDRGGAHPRRSARSSPTGYLGAEHRRFGSLTATAATSARCYPAPVRESRLIGKTSSGPDQPPSLKSSVNRPSCLHPQQSRGPRERQLAHASSRTLGAREPLGAVAARVDDKVRAPGFGRILHHELTAREAAEKPCPRAVHGGPRAFGARARRGRVPPPMRNSESCGSKPNIEQDSRCRRLCVVMVFGAVPRVRRWRRGRDSSADDHSVAVSKGSAFLPVAKGRGASGASIHSSRVGLGGEGRGEGRGRVRTRGTGVQI